MDDLISRQAAINAVHKEFDDCIVWDESGMTTANEVEKILDSVPSAQPERKPGRWIETEGLDEEIRCIMCSNPMKTNRGCNGLCRYNEHLYHEIISVLENRITKVE